MNCLIIPAFGIYKLLFQLCFSSDVFFIMKLYLYNHRILYSCAKDLYVGVVAICCLIPCSQCVIPATEMNLVDMAIKERDVRLSNKDSINSSN